MLQIFAFSWFCMNSACCNTSSVQWRASHSAKLLHFDDVLHILQNFFSSMKWAPIVTHSLYFSLQSFSGWETSKDHLQSLFRSSSNNSSASFSVQGRLEPIVKIVPIQAVDLFLWSFKFRLLYEITVSNVGKYLNTMSCRHSATCSCNVMDECTEALRRRIPNINIMASDYRTRSYKKIVCSLCLSLVVKHLCFLLEYSLFLCSVYKINFRTFKFHSQIKTYKRQDNETVKRIRLQITTYIDFLKSCYDLCTTCDNWMAFLGENTKYFVAKKCYMTVILF
jgi:hypothetical protein